MWHVKVKPVLFKIFALTLFLFAFVFLAVQIPKYDVNGFLPYQKMLEVLENQSKRL